MKSRFIVIGVILLLGQTLIGWGDSFGQQFTLEWEIQGLAYYVGDVDGDDIGELVTRNESSTTFYDGRGHEAKWTITTGSTVGLYFEESWFETEGGSPYLYTVHPSIDYNGDGKREFIFQSKYEGVYERGDVVFDVVNNTKLFEVSDLPQGTEGITIKALADIDGDKELELIVSIDTRDGEITRIYSTRTPVATLIGGSGNSDTPSAYLLRQNYPNPFNPTTTIEYDIQKNEHATLRIYDSLGQVTKMLVNGPKQVGSYSVVWDGTDEGGKHVASGVYFYQLQVGDFVSNKRMLLLK